MAMDKVRIVRNAAAAGHGSAGSGVPGLCCRADAAEDCAVAVRYRTSRGGGQHAYLHRSPSGIGPLLGTNRAGFVARRPKNGVLGLKPNITRDGMIDDLFTTMSSSRWQNHKVIEYGGEYFDPSYGC